MTQPRRSYTLITAPATEPVSAAEVKTLARIDHSTEDALIEDFIKTARVAAENYTGLAFITQAWRLTLDLPRCGLDDVLGEGHYDLPSTLMYGGLPGEIELPRFPVISITSVTTYDVENTGTAYPSDNYTLDSSAGRLVLTDTAVWPSPMREAAACQIVTSNGYGASADVPMPIRMAIRMHAAQLFETRGACGCDVPPACQQLLRQYKRDWL